MNNSNNYLNKLEEKIDNENLMYANDDKDTTPPPRPKRFTVSYAQAAKTSPAVHQNINANSNLLTTQVSTSTMTTTATSTITQESRKEALQNFQLKINSTIENFKKDTQKEISSIKERMTAAVVKALQKAPREITTVTETCENSACTNAQESQQTMSTLVNKVESLADSVALLAESVKILQHKNSQKRNQMAPPKTPDMEMKDADSSSPPSKQQKA
jgi:hypothetical protein